MFLMVEENVFSLPMSVLSKVVKQTNKTQTKGPHPPSHKPKSLEKALFSLHNHNFKRSPLVPL